MNAALDQIDPETETRFIDVDGHHLRVSVRRGSSPRPPLLMLNGLGVRVEGLQPFVDALRPDATVIRVDVPGTGESASPALPYRMWQVARLTSHALDALGVEEVDTLGVSWGGALAQQFAFQYRRRCRRLILVSTAAGALIPGRPQVVREMLTRRRFDDAKHASRVAPIIYGGKARQAPQALSLFDHMSTSRRGLFYQQLAVLGWSSIPFSRLIRQPTLILTGDDDPVIPPLNGRLLEAIIPHARLHIFHDGHLGLLTSADELAPIVEDFLDQP
ncbi:MAG: poly(3-hydroxyalkanoate) depolymerase [Actinomycetota bacterium]|uniref:Poly(3-hydroxyalkanoate) depolymerase n=1 Tax=Mycobacterium lentiflavum TaxID=141349 RepID=A0ABY3ULQ4_MYCLN|nr:poly(3-hydroxyalkanoate) depolymerase [Mycobacterium lentiflavum]MEE3062436.1 poly(3-hydroxyalkanoate) depolymerase [Actinomycetota bacterium]ULP40339.1 poly(3-hydroxyalkanoate) depolymerase [Mycobacterium lentiflavum]